MSTFTQAIKYGIIGVSNTAITAVVIFVLLQLLHVPEHISNILGYIAGVINSFIWNKKWTFNSSGKWGQEAFRFGIGFFCCWALQYLLVLVLNDQFTYPHIYNHYVGMIFYTVINFIANKFFIFKK